MEHVAWPSETAAAKETIDSTWNELSALLTFDFGCLFLTLGQLCYVVLLVSGHKSRHKREEDPADLPDVGFVSSKPNRRQTRPMSEVIPGGVPYSSRRKDKRQSLQLSYTGSSTDDDERTNRAAEVKKTGTFAVGLASRNIEHSEPAGESDSEHEETCEYCAAEKVWSS